MTMRALLSGFALLTTMLASPVRAHHSFAAEFLADQTLTKRAPRVSGIAINPNKK